MKRKREGDDPNEKKKRKKEDQIKLLPNAGEIAEAFSCEKSMHGAKEILNSDNFKVLISEKYNLITSSFKPEGRYIVFSSKVCVHRKSGYIKSAECNCSHRDILYCPHVVALLLAIDRKERLIDLERISNVLKDVNEESDLKRMIFDSYFTGYNETTVHHVSLFQQILKEAKSKKNKDVVLEVSQTGEAPSSHFMDNRAFTTRLIQEIASFNLGEREKNCKWPRVRCACPCHKMSPPRTRRRSRNIQVARKKSKKDCVYCSKMTVKRDYRPISDLLRRYLTIIGNIVSGNIVLRNEDYSGNMFWNENAGQSIIDLLMGLLSPFFDNYDVINKSYTLNQDEYQRNLKSRTLILPVIQSVCAKIGCALENIISTGQKRRLEKAMLEWSKKCGPAKRLVDTSTRVLGQACGLVKGEKNVNVIRLRMKSIMRNGPWNLVGKTRYLLFYLRKVLEMNCKINGTAGKIIKQENELDTWIASRIAQAEFFIMGVSGVAAQMTTPGYFEKQRLSFIFNCSLLAFLGVATRTKSLGPTHSETDTLKVLLDALCPTPSWSHRGLKMPKSGDLLREVDEKLNLVNKHIQVIVDDALKREVITPVDVPVLREVYKGTTGKFNIKAIENSVEEDFIFFQVTLYVLISGSEGVDHDKIYANTLGIRRSLSTAKHFQRMARIFSRNGMLRQTVKVLQNCVKNDENKMDETEDGVEDGGGGGFEFDKSFGLMIYKLAGKFKVGNNAESDINELKVLVEGTSKRVMDMDMGPVDLLQFVSESLDPVLAANSNGGGSNSSELSEVIVRSLVKCCLKAFSTMAKNCVTQNENIDQKVFGDYIKIMKKMQGLSSSSEGCAVMKYHVLKVMNATEDDLNIIQEMQSLFKKFNCYSSSKDDLLGYVLPLEYLRHLDNINFVQKAFSTFRSDADISSFLLPMFLSILKRLRLPNKPTFRNQYFENILRSSNAHRCKCVQCPRIRRFLKTSNDFNDTLVLHYSHSVSSDFGDHVRHIKTRFPDRLVSFKSHFMSNMTGNESFVRADISMYQRKVVLKKQMDYWRSTFNVQFEKVEGLIEKLKANVVIQMLRSYSDCLSPTFLGDVALEMRRKEVAAKMKTNEHLFINLIQSNSNLLLVVRVLKNYAKLSEALGNLLDANKFLIFALQKANELKSEGLVSLVAKIAQRLGDTAIVVKCFRQLFLSRESVKAYKKFRQSCQELGDENIWQKAHSDLFVHLRRLDKEIINARGMHNNVKYSDREYLTKIRNRIEIYVQEKNSTFILNAVLLCTLTECFSPMIRAELLVHLFSMLTKYEIGEEVVNNFYNYFQSLLRKTKDIRDMENYHNFFSHIAKTQYRSVAFSLAYFRHTLLMKKVAGQGTGRRYNQGDYIRVLKWLKCYLKVFRQLGLPRSHWEKKMGEWKEMYWKRKTQLRNLIENDTELKRKWKSKYDKNNPAAAAGGGGGDVKKKKKKPTPPPIRPSQDSSVEVIDLVSSSEEEDVIFQKESEVLECPITLDMLLDPVKNTRCSHCYSREGITLYMKEKQSTPRFMYGLFGRNDMGQISVPCPVAGCQETVCEDSLMDDPDTKSKVLKHFMEKEDSNDEMDLDDDEEDEMEMRLPKCFERKYMNDVAGKSKKKIVPPRNVIVISDSD